MQIEISFEIQNYIRLLFSLKKINMLIGIIFNIGVPKYVNMHLFCYNCFKYLYLYMAYVNCDRAKGNEKLNRLSDTEVIEK